MFLLDDRRIRLLHIYACRGVGQKTIEKLVSLDPTLDIIYKMTVSELMAVCGMPKKQAEMFYDDLHTTSIVRSITRKTNSFRVLTRFDDEYPPLLNEIFDPPWVLFYKGDLSLLSNEKTLAVVGTRNPSNHAFPIMKKLLVPLIRSNWCIVSGLAYGIDAIGHRLALAENGQTIAVLGSGIESIYPPEHKQLADEIAVSGLLLSEFLPDQPAQKWQFPVRNRLISGLAKGTLVVEARERSGSLITADQALEQGREVFAVPGSILQPSSAGTNGLIQQGAKLVLSAKDIEEELL